MTELTQAIGELKTLLGQTENELNSLLAGKKASAPRMRASLQKIKSVSHSMRAVVMDYTKSLPVKSRKVLDNDTAKQNRRKQKIVSFPPNRSQAL